jgi:hypothetical protein
MTTPFFIAPPLAKMSSTMTLNTRVHIVSKSGKKETITARELLARGTGTAFEAFKMLDEYDDLAKAFDVEVRFAEACDKHREDHLPFGAHLLPDDYQDFLYGWNKHMTATTGWWNGPERASYWALNPDDKARFTREHKAFKQRYPAEVQAVRDYQATHTMEESSEESNCEEQQSAELHQIPSLPPSPVVASDSEESDYLEQIKAEALDIISHHDYQLGTGDYIIRAFCNEHLIPYLERNPGSHLDTLVREKTACYANYPIGERVRLELRGNTIGFLTHLFHPQQRLALPQLQPQQPQVIPQVLPVVPQELAQQPDTNAEDHEAPARRHNPIYTNRLWPSPVAKLFVQHMRGPTWTFEMRSNWLNAGNTEFKLTHDNCMRYLAYKMGRIRISKLMEIHPKEVHALVIGKYFGVPGFYTKADYYPYL